MKSATSKPRRPLNKQRGAVPLVAVGATWLLSALFACSRPGTEQIMADFETLPSAPSATARPVALAAATKASASASGSAVASASGSAMASASASGGGPPAKTFECGSKGQPDCPMQRWMKSVAGNAVASGDNEKLARAFDFMGGHAPPGFGNWSGFCAAGSAKARAGDFDGAKAECKKCHVATQARYHASMRDIKWP